MTADQQSRIITAVTLGAARVTAAHYVGCQPGEIDTFAEQDEDFAMQLRRAEATAEINHLRTIHTAIKEPRNWRASIWWLKQRHPDRYDRKADAVNPQELREFIDHIMETIAEVVPPEYCEALDEKLQHIAGRQS